MMKIALIALMSLVALASAASVPARAPILAANAVSIVKSNPFGIVENVADCGSTGTLHTVSVTDCTMAPCDLTPGRTYDIQILFTASRNAERLSLNIKVKQQNGDEHTIASVPVNGNIVGGQQFTISFGFPITSDFSGQSLLVWFELVDNADMQREICATASAHIG